MTHNSIRGKAFGNGPVLNGIAEIKFQVKNQKQKTIKCIIENEEQFSMFKLVLKSWYLEGLSIKEFFSDEKLYSLNLEPIGNKSYKEIKKLREELNLK